MAWTSQFILENENGERYDLTAPAPIYMVNVEGLGVETGDSFGGLDNGFFILTSSHDPQNGITADLIYMAGAYENYTSLVNWLHKATTLYFCYTPIDTEYKRIVRLKTLQKSRRDGAGWMRSMISFDCLSPWYLPSPTEIGITPIDSDTKGYLDDGEGNYGYTYTETLHYGSDSAGDMSATIAASGHIPSAFILRYTGALRNPEIRLTGVSSGKLYGLCAVTATLGATDTLELSTLYGDSHIWKIASNGTVTDLLPSVDLTHDVYPRAPTEEPSTLSLTSDTQMTGSVELSIYAYYRSV